jgi:hypothetical protein
VRDPTYSTVSGADQVVQRTEAFTMKTHVYASDDDLKQGR